MAGVASCAHGYRVDDFPPATFTLRGTLAVADFDLSPAARERAALPQGFCIPTEAYFEDGGRGITDSMVRHLGHSGLFDRVRLAEDAGEPADYVLEGSVAEFRSCPTGSIVFFSACQGVRESCNEESGGCICYRSRVDLSAVRLRDARTGEVLFSGAVTAPDRPYGAPETESSWRPYEHALGATVQRLVDRLTLALEERADAAPRPR